MKQIIILLLIFISKVACSQDCDYRYKYACYIIQELDSYLTEEQKENISQDIIDYKICLGKIIEKDKRYWLNNSIAIRYDMLNGSQDSITYYAKKAFDNNEKNFCEDYVEVHVFHERGEMFPMKPHYVDKAKTSQLTSIREHCIANYKDAKLKQFKEIEQEKVGIENSTQFNEVYLEELTNISIKDQEERIKETVNWSRQNQLDSLNRAKLDSLYLLYGFPSKSIVTEDGYHNAFMVLHHSTNCEWNELWFRRFLKDGIPDRFKNITSFYLYRNFNETNGICKHRADFWNELKDRRDLEELLKFDKFDKDKK